MIPTYLNMKDSGAEWLGDIPADWKPYRLGMLGYFSASGIDKKIVEGEPLVQMVNYTDVYGSVTKELAPYAGLMTVSCPEEKIRYHSLAIGDILFTPSSETADDIAYSAVVVKDMPNTVYSYHLIRFRPKADIAVGYRKYLCNNRFVLSQFTRTCKGTTRQILVRDDFKNIVVVIPPSGEQETITSFLDRKTALIDDLIAKRVRQIELLQEQRTALISRVVTKGLNPDVPMKDSGVEWIGRIPSHWKVERSKVVFREVNDRHNGSEQELLTVSHITGVTRRSEKNVNMFLAESTEGYKKCVAGDLVINTMWAWMGALGMATLSGIVSPAYNVYRFRHNGFSPDYYDKMFRSSVFITEINRWSKGIWSSRLRLYPNEFFEIRIPVPPDTEQKRIAEYLQQKISGIEKFVVKTQESIALLREYRNAIISAAVTGKIDVRNWQPSSEPAEESLHA